MKRPLLWVFGILLALFLVVRFFYGSNQDADYYILDCFMEESAEATAMGELDSIDTKPNSYYLYLKNVSVSLNSQKETYSFSNLLVITKNISIASYQPGNILKISGEIQKLQIPSNPGQFNEKNFYKEKNIYYKMYSTQIQILDHKVNHIKSALFHLKESLAKVYKMSLPSKDAGLISAMLLGDKSTLDMEIKELYQINGIGHILAISGLHISILCMILYQILSRLFLPSPLPLIITIFFLLAYGIMTGFGISTSRAILMMVIMLFGKEIGRSYDALTAMACSAIIILLQKPYAVFSCSFLLSYSSVAGVVLIMPVLKGIFLGTLQEQNQKIQKKRRKRKEKIANGKIKLMIKLTETIKEKIQSLILCSLSIWIATLPIMLYFYYEIPTYGILLNLFVLPLVSTVVVLSLAGGVIGLFCLPFGAWLLSLVHFILSLYEWLCHLFLELPCPVQILGCPAIYKMIIYYLVLFCIYLALKRQILYREHLIPFHKAVSILSFGFVLTLLIFRTSGSMLQITMLDVGQGDGIVIKNETGRNILIDGGSTDVSQVGKYRILPFLKHQGIRKIDYMIMTHADEDHISGQLELLESYKTNGLKIGCCLLPNPDKKCKDSNYKNLIQAARMAGVPVRYIQSGNAIHSGKLSLLCVHPDKGFESDSANAYSTTLSLTYGKNSMLLTGDLEGEGEEALMEKFSQKSFSFPARYDILKVAHHGSKNSSSEEYLKRISPKLALISCGKNNRYGHPHKNLLERLDTVHSKVLKTPDTGAIFLYSDGNTWKEKSYLLDE